MSGVLGGKGWAVIGLNICSSGGRRRLNFKIYVSYTPIIIKQNSIKDQ